MLAQSRNGILGVRTGKANDGPGTDELMRGITRTMLRTRCILMLTLVAVIQGCLAKHPPQSLSSSELEQALTTKCREANPQGTASEIGRCVADAAQTYARGLETFEQQYPLAPARVQCGADARPGSPIQINCR